MVRIANKYGDSVAVVGVDLRDDPDEARAYREKYHIRYPIVVDDDGSVYKDFGLPGIPTHMLLDARGAILCISIGDLTPAQMDNEAGKRRPERNAGHRWIARALSAPRFVEIVVEAARYVIEDDEQ